MLSIEIYAKLYILLFAKAPITKIKHSSRKSHLTIEIVPAQCQ